MNKPRLTLADFQRAALLLNAPVASVRAVTSVESGGGGFLADGRLVLRFEPHIFSKYTQGRFDAAHPDVSYATWRSGNPTSIAHSYQLFTKAAGLDGYAAGLSCSYGLFQCMGFNFAMCGCKTFKEFYTRMNASEGEQLALFCAYVRNAGLDDEMRRQDWAGFALHYNGKLYKVNKYDTKLAAAFQRYS